MHLDIRTRQEARRRFDGLVVPASGSGRNGDDRTDVSRLRKGEQGPATADLEVVGVRAQTDDPQVGRTAAGA